MEDELPWTISAKKTLIDFFKQALTKAKQQGAEERDAEILKIIPAFSVGTMELQEYVRGRNDYREAILKLLTKQE